MKIECKPWNGSEIKRYAHAKIDGHFTRIYKNEFGLLIAESSQSTQLTLPNTGWRRNLQKLMPEDAIILGELYYPGKPASYVKTALAQKDERICFSAFALEHLPAELPLKYVQVHCLQYGIEFTPFMELVWTTELPFDYRYSDVNLLYTHLPQYQTRTKAILEGFVLKDGNLLNWRKLKTTKTIDAFICGYTKGQGKYKGKIGSLEVAVYDDKKDIIIIATAGGFSDDMRDWITENQNYCWRQVVEIEYQYVGSQGRLRHPRFKQFRDDKRAEECTIHQDCELEGFYNV